MKQTHQDWWSKNLWPMRTWGNKLAMTAWKRWRIWRLELRWHGWVVCQTATIWCGTTRARNYILRKWSLQRKNAMSQPPLSSFKNNLGDSIQFVKTSFNSKFCQFIDSKSFCSPINTLPAFLSPRVSETPPYPNGTMHNLAYMSQRPQTLRESMRMHFQISSDSTCNMIQPELVAIPAILQYYKQCYAASWAWQRCKKAEQLHFVHDL